MSGAGTMAVRGIRKSFGNVIALRDIDLDVWAGEVIGLIGDNGAGKSTFIKILSGYERPDAGTIEMDGKRVRFRSPADARAVGIETVYQEQALADDLTVGRNLFLGRELRRKVGPLWILDARGMYQQAEAILSELRLRVDVNQEAKYCSGGERQGIAIARAIHVSARLLILDEPTNALGVVAVGEVLRLVTGLKARGIACIFISHNTRHVYEVCDRIVMFVNGSMVLDTPTKDVGEEAIVRMLNEKSGSRVR